MPLRRFDCFLQMKSKADFICKDQRFGFYFIAFRQKQIRFLQMAAWLNAAVTDTTPLNPRCSTLAFRPFTGRGKNNRTSLCASKQNFFFFFQFAHSCDLEYPLPLFSSPFPGSSHSSFREPCASCCLLPMFLSCFDRPPCPHHRRLPTPFSLCKS